MYWPWMKVSVCTLLDTWERELAVHLPNVCTVHDSGLNNSSDSSHTYDCIRQLSSAVYVGMVVVVCILEYNRKSSTSLEVANWRVERTGNTPDSPNPSSMVITQQRMESILNIFRISSLSSSILFLLHTL